MIFEKIGLERGEINKRFEKNLKIKIMEQNNYRKIVKKEFDQILRNEEGDYVDFISSGASGARIQEKIVEFANSEGGSLYVGIKDEGLCVIG